MKKVAAFIVDKRNIIFFIFTLLAIFSAFSRNWVDVENDITAYLPDNTETRTGLTIMNDNFTTFATAEIMVENITLDTANYLYDEIEKCEGVKSIAFDAEDDYKQASALFTITFDGEENDEISIEGLEKVNELLSNYDTYSSTEIGNPLKAIVNSEMLIVDLIAVFIVVTVLLLTSTTYAEIPVLLITFGAAAVLNMGTNFMMGTISFVTDSIAIVLQLALAIDYAIIFLHRYQEEHEKLAAKEAVVEALTKAIPEISGSSLTTVAGLAAMCLMQFTLGLDMGIVLIKAILLSLASVFFLMPGLLVVFSDWIDKTPHKSFVPKISFLGKFDYATRFIIPLIFIGVLICGFLFSHRTSYAYTEDSIIPIKLNETQIAENKICDVFGKENQLALIVPRESFEKEGKLIKELEELEHTVSVLGLANVEALDGYMITDSLNPRQFSEITGLDYEVAEALYAAYAVNQEDYGQLVTNIENYSMPLIDIFEYLIDMEKEVTISLDEETKDKLDDLDGQLEDAKLQLLSDGWSRIVLQSDLPIEGEDSFKYLEIVHGIVGKYYDEGYVIGDMTSSYDLRTSFEHDNTLISILTIVFVLLVLLFTFSSVGLPVLLIMIIQGSIWINFSTPYLKGENLFFMTYLIVSSIQMGANIDYAIVISSRYLENKETMPIKEAMIETLNFSFPTIITSGTMLASAGLIIGYLTSEPTISTIGLFLGQGTFISIFLVMCVLPQILILGDLIIRKTTFSINMSNKAVKRTGIMRVDGRVRGQFTGYLDAEVHGLIRGDLNATIEIGNPDGEEKSDD